MKIDENKAKKARIGFNRWVIVITVVLMLIFAGGIEVALYRTQIRDHEYLTLEAARQYYSKAQTQPARGDIVDRNGVKVAGTHYEYMIGITPVHLRSRYSSGEKSQSQEQIAQKLAALLELDYNNVLLEMAKTDAQYIPLKSAITEEKAQELEKYINAYLIGGIRIDPKPKRYYLNGNVASQVIGFATYNEDRLHGQLGLELRYDDILSGQPGMTYAARDNYGNRSFLPYSAADELEVRNGNRLVMTLDMEICAILQEELENTIRSYNIQNSGMAIVMDPNNGEILGMASYPFFNLSDPTGPPSGADKNNWNPNLDTTREYLNREVWRNRNHSDLYEAGSTFKTITAAIGLEENVTTEKTPYNDQPIKVMDHTISCVSGDGHGTESMEEAFIRSCNPVFVQIAQAIGVEKYYNYIRAFGFYESTGIDLPAEAACSFHTKPSAIDLATLSFGEQSAVTPLHLVRAYAALVNGGYLVKPHVVKDITTTEGKIVANFNGSSTRQVISAETSARIRKLMQSMVENAGPFVDPGGFKAGGKTSTSTNEATNKTTVSFMEAAPIDHPSIVALMVFQEPNSLTINGSAAQIATMRTVNRILEYMNIDRSYGNQDIKKMNNAVAMPNLIGLTLAEAQEKLLYYNISVAAFDKTMKADDQIRIQLPPEGTPIYSGTRITVCPKVAPDKKAQVPNFIGMNFSEAINAANEAGLIINFSGNVMGTVAAQRAEDAVTGNTKPQEGEAKAKEPGSPGTELAWGSVIRIGMK